jgi:hypothetical protein
MAARWAAVGVAPNSPTSVVAGAALQSAAPPFIVAVSSLVTFAALAASRPNNESRQMIRKIMLRVRVRVIFIKYNESSRQFLFRVEQVYKLL